MNAVAIVPVWAGTHKAQVGIHGVLDSCSVPSLFAARHLERGFGLIPIGSESSVVLSLWGCSNIRHCPGLTDMGVKRHANKPARF